MKGVACAIAVAVVVALFVACSGDDDDADQASDAGADVQDCEELQELAEEQGIESDIECPDEEDGTEDERGSGDAEAYFEELEELSRAFEDDGDELSDELAEDVDTAVADDGLSVDEAADFLVEFIEDSLALTEEFIEDFSQLEPSAEAEEAHDAALDALEEAVEFLEEVLDEAPGLSAEEIEELLTTDQAEDVEEAGEEACEDLQDIADDLDIDVDLECGDDSEPVGDLDATSTAEEDFTSTPEETEEEVDEREAFTDDEFFFLTQANEEFSCEEGGLPRVLTAFYEITFLAIEPSLGLPLPEGCLDILDAIIEELERLESEGPPAECDEYVRLSMALAIAIRDEDVEVLEAYLADLDPGEGIESSASFDAFNDAFAECHDL